MFLQSEYSKMLLIWQLIDGNRDEFPEDSITDNEKVLIGFIYAVISPFLTAFIASKHVEVQIANLLFLVSIIHSSLRSEDF